MYHIAASMRRLGIAMLLVFIVGTALGIACGMNRKILAAVDPFIQFYRALPPLAYNTLIVLWMGIGDGSKIMLLFLSGFAPLFIQIVFGVQKVPQDRINGARSLGAGNFVIFRDVILPSVLPDILTDFVQLLVFPMQRWWRGNDRICIWTCVDGAGCQQIYPVRNGLCRDFYYGRNCTAD